jgi:hypothetical protein
MKGNEKENEKEKPFHFLSFTFRNRDFSMGYRRLNKKTSLPSGWRPDVSTLRFSPLGVVSAAGSRSAESLRALFGNAKALFAASQNVWQNI